MYLRAYINFGYIVTKNINNFLVYPLGIKVTVDMLSESNFFELLLNQSSVHKFFFTRNVFRMDIYPLFSFTFK